MLAILVASAEVGTETLTFILNDVSRSVLQDFVSNEPKKKDEAYVSDTGTSISRLGDFLGS